MHYGKARITIAYLILFSFYRILDFPLGSLSTIKYLSLCVGGDSPMREIQG